MHSAVSRCAFATEMFISLQRIGDEKWYKTKLIKKTLPQKKERRTKEEFKHRFRLVVTTGL